MSPIFFEIRTDHMKLNSSVTNYPSQLVADMIRRLVEAGIESAAQVDTLENITAKMELVFYVLDSTHEADCRRVVKAAFALAEALGQYSAANHIKAQYMNYIGQLWQESSLNSPQRLKYSEMYRNVEQWTNQN